MKRIAVFLLLLLLVGCAGIEPNADPSNVYEPGTDIITTDDNNSHFYANSPLDIYEPSEDTPANENLYDIRPINNFSNTINGGSFFIYKGFVYGQFFFVPCERRMDLTYYFSQSRLGKEDMSTKVRTIIKSDEYVSNICATNDRIYFKDSGMREVSIDDDEGAIYSIALDGSDKIRITTDLVDLFFIYNGYIYYLTQKNNRSIIMECTLYGDNLREIYSTADGENDLSAFSIYSGSIYIARNSHVGPSLIAESLEDNSVKDYSPYLSNITYINDFSCIREGDYIFFLTDNAERESFLYKLNVITFELSIVMQCSRTFSVQDGFLYTVEYLDFDETTLTVISTINRINLVNNDVYTIKISAIIDEFEIHDGYIYCSLNHGYEFYRFNIDDPENIENITVRVS